MKNKGRFPKQGFTLIEVLVALAVVGLALPALLFLVQQQLDGVSHLRDKTTAHWVAVNKLTELRLTKRISGAVPTGRASGEQEMLGRTWYWRSASEQTSEENFYRIEIQVSLMEGADNSLYSIVGYLGVGL